MVDGIGGRQSSGGEKRKNTLVSEYWRGSLLRFCCETLDLKFQGLSCVNEEESADFLWELFSNSGHCFVMRLRLFNVTLSTITLTLLIIPATSFQLVRQLFLPRSYSALSTMPKRKSTSTVSKKSVAPSRRSSRLSGVEPKSYKEENIPKAEKTVSKKSKKGLKKKDDDKADGVAATLPRTRETTIRKKIPNVMGIDEAGRGPLAGPVVTAACLFPASAPLVPGVGDSKTITDENERERLYEEIIKVPGVRFCVAVIDSKRIDAINILQATCEGMRASARGVVEGCSDKKPSAKRDGSYTFGNVKDSLEGDSYALVDGNRFPSFRGNEDEKVTKNKDDMICDGEPMIKGDGREYVIAAASILAKVSRDRIMREYDVMYPQYNLKQHKGYPTAAHQSAIFEHGVSKIHRRTFAPIKNWKVNKNGSIKK